MQDVWGLLHRFSDILESHGLNPTLVAHPNFGGATSAIHAIGAQGVDLDVFCSFDALPRQLGHVISTLVDSFCQEIEALSSINDPLPCAPIMHQVDILHPDGLWDVTRPNLHVGCRLVFKRTG
jgi:hypothetical protein